MNKNLTYRDGSYYSQNGTKLNERRISTWGIEKGNDLVILTTLNHQQIVAVLHPIIESAKKDASALKKTMQSLESESLTMLKTEMFYYRNAITEIKRLIEAKESGAFYDQALAVESLQTAYPDEITEMGCIEDFSNY